MRTSDQVVSPLHSVCLASGGCIGRRSVMEPHQGSEWLKHGPVELRWALSSRRSIVDDSIDETSGRCRCCGKEVRSSWRGDRVCDRCGRYVDAGAARWSKYRQGPRPSRPELLAALVRLCQDDAADRREAMDRLLAIDLARRRQDDAAERRGWSVFMVDPSTWLGQSPLSPGVMSGVAGSASTTEGSGWRVFMVDPSTWLGQSPLRPGDASGAAGSASAAEASAMPPPVSMRPRAA